MVPSLFLYKYTKNNDKNKQNINASINAITPGYQKEELYERLGLIAMPCITTITVFFLPPHPPFLDSFCGISEQHTMQCCVSRMTANLLSNTFWPQHLYLKYCAKQTMWSMRCQKGSEWGFFFLFIFTVFKVSQKLFRKVPYMYNRRCISFPKWNQILKQPGESPLLNLPPFFQMSDFQVKQRSKRKLENLYISIIVQKLHSQLLL